MAGAYSFPLLVELEENQVPRLKNKLVKYFQSRKSNGGDCEVDYENGSRTATLRFRSEEGESGPASPAPYNINNVSSACLVHCDCCFTLSQTNKTF